MMLPANPGWWLLLSNESAETVKVVAIVGWAHNDDNSLELLPVTSDAGLARPYDDADVELSTVYDPQRVVGIGWGTAQMAFDGDYGPVDVEIRRLKARWER